MIKTKAAKVTLFILVIIVALNFLHIENSYAHSTSSNIIYHEAYFYGVPTFDLDNQATNKENQHTSSDELEVMRRQFWGITIR